MTQPLNPWVEQFVDRTIAMLQNETLKKKIQIMVLEPFCQYFLELAFPYILLVCVIFAVIILLLISAVGLLVYQAGYRGTDIVSSVSIS